MSNTDNLKIAAVVVTRNRVMLLKRCLQCLLQQTRPLQAIIVVDCQSSDGTRDYLKQAASPITPIFLDENAGSGGGQYAGTKYAYDHGYDWVWCMDDDGFASVDALQKIMEVVNTVPGNWFNSLVLNIANPTKTAFQLYSGNVYLSDVVEIQAAGAVIEGANPFNGTLLSRHLFDEIGFPNKDLFIWGDELEFLKRANSHNMGVFTATQSLYYHPDSTSFPLFAVHHKTFWKHYYLIRNAESSGYKDGRLVFSKRGSLRAGWYVLSRLWRGTFRAMYYNVGKSWIVIKAVIAAWRQDRSRRYPR